VVGVVPVSRPSFEGLYMDLAAGLASRSTCARAQVGCVIATTDYRRILAVGYNGSAKGHHNGCDSKEPGNCGCLHAEENAIISCTEPRSTDKVVLTTYSPCVMCAKRIVNLGGVQRCYFRTQYRSAAGIHLLGDSGIVCTHLG